MAGRGTSDSPNTRNPQRPARKPSRLDQFADDIFENNRDKNMGVTSKNEKKKWLR